MPADTVNKDVLVLRLVQEMKRGHLRPHCKAQEGGPDKRSHLEPHMPLHTGDRHSNGDKPTGACRELHSSFLKPQRPNVD